MMHGIRERWEAQFELDLITRWQSGGRDNNYRKMYLGKAYFF